MDFCDFAGFVRHTRARGQTSGDAFVKFLALEDFDHLAGGLLIDRFSTQGDLTETTGRSAFAGDAAYTYENLERLIVGGFHLDPTASVESLRRGPSFSIRV